MPSYNKKYKESNVNYLNKDFSSLKNSLVQYAKSYFPNTYKDFNETSTGMMLMEMSAYVGDVLSFYIDQQYKEMMMPLAEERRNIKNISKMLGYKIKPIVPAFVNLTFKQNVDIKNRGLTNADPTSIDYEKAGVFDKGIKVTGTANSNVIFETLEVLDFSIEKEGDKNIIGDTDDAGLALSYQISRTIRAVSGETKTKTFTIDEPTKFRKITLSEKNVIDILNVKDSNGNTWYEVEYLAQDTVPHDIHYVDDGSRQGVYYDIGTSSVETIPVPYTLDYIKTSKRFITEVNDDDTTSLVFGNGILKNGSSIEDGFLDLQQVGITIPGQPNELQSAINPLLGDEYSTLGETPNQVTLTINYRIGGGVSSNVAAGELASASNLTKIKGPDGSTIESVTNNEPASGGKSSDTIDEIRQKALAQFTTQNRAVTKEDYEARVFNMPSKYGSIAKVYAVRSDVDFTGDVQTIQTNIESVQQQATQAYNDIHTMITQDFGQQVIEQGGNVTSDDVTELSQNIVQFFDPLLQSINNIPSEFSTNTRLGTIALYILSYDKFKNLTGNYYANSLTDAGATTYGVPNLLKTNIKNYLENYKILTDFIEINDGFVVNFGVAFDVVANATANKTEVKLRCIETIKNFFKIEKMGFGQPILLSDLEYQLMSIDGVLSLNYVCVTQGEVYLPLVTTPVQVFSPRLYTYSIATNDETGGVGDTGVIVAGDNDSDSENQTGYGWKYDFAANYDSEARKILPVNPNNPAVFELKNPNQNIVGIVR